MVASLLAACGARSGVLVDDGSTDFGASGASAGQSGIRTAGAPGRAGAPFGGAPSAGAPFGGAPSAGAPGAGGGPTTACTPDGSNCPNGFACIAGSCLTKCDSLEQCRPDRFCAEGSACPLRAKHIAAGVSDTCAVLVDDSVRCWGDGDAGQLGDGLANTSTTPVTVKAVAGAASGIDQIELGVLFACAVTALGQGSCWGAGDLGQLGAGTLDASSTPVPTLGSGPMGKLLQVGAGRYHACGIWAGGEVRCWGANFDGQLGTGDTMSTVKPVPIAAKPDPNIHRVSSGDSHSCLLISGGLARAKVRCWGDNSELQLGVSGPTHSSTPLDLDLPGKTADISDLQAGAYHNCVLRSDGSVLCWGDNSQQQLGVPLPTLSAVPQLVKLPAGAYAVAISAGEHHTLALLKDGRVLCWGNAAACGVQTMNGTGPVAIGNLDPPGNFPTAISAGATHSCALMSDGSVRCWGSNYDGALGTPATEYAATATPVRPW